MKKYFVLIIVVVFAVFSTTGVNAVTLFTDGAYTYADIDEDYVALYSFDNSSDTLVVQARSGSQYVSSIYNYAFLNNKTIKNVDFSANKKWLSYIGVKAFANSALSGELTLPSCVNEIGIGAFQDCDDVKSAIINCSVRDIPAQVFYECDKLESAYLPVLTENIGNLAFANCPKLKNVYLPSSVISISDTAFSGSDNVVFNCYKNTYAYNYAVEHNIPVVLVDPLLGDVNGDEEINIMDATIIQKKSLGIATADVVSNYDVVADVNRDGIVNIRDVTLIQMYVAGIITEF